LYIILWQQTALPKCNLLINLLMNQIFICSFQNIWTSPHVQRIC
jgi:hypothetical protein